MHMSLTPYNYGQVGVHEPGGIAQMRYWLAERSYRWTVRGIHVGVHTKRVFNLPNGQADKPLKLLSPWNGPHALRVAGPGWSNNRISLPKNPNGSAHALIWVPDGTEPRAQIVVHSDAPRMDVIHGPTGIFTSALLTWPALRNGLQTGGDVVTAVFEEMARAVEEMGYTFYLRDVFAHVGYGARKGYGLRLDGALWMMGIENEDSKVPDLF